MKVGTLKLLLDIMSHLATNMPHIAPFECSKGHGAPSDDFLDKYVSHAVGNHYFLHFLQWSKLNKSKTFLDKVTASDIAYTILVNENTKVEAWEEDLQIKASYKTDEERHNAKHHKKTKYHVGRGKRLKRFGGGWTDNGPEYYQELLRIFKEFKSSDVWITLQDH